MRAYRVNLPLENPAFEGTMALAREVVKERNKDVWSETTIDEVEVQADKEGVLHALNRNPVINVIRTWGITARGGLKEE